MDLYEQYRNLPIDHSLVGLIPGERESNYFCTPLGACVIGWTGVDGVHFCTVEGYGERVFCVCPMDLPGEYVHPVADNFEDFLRLVLACRGTAAIAQAYGWTRERFDSFVSSDQVDISTQTALAAISNGFSLEAMEDPYAYIRRLQREVDLSGLRFPKEYDEWAPQVTKPQPWKVTFGGSFDHHAGKAGKEIRLDHSFLWGDTRWYVPAVYTCAEGLVVDILAEGNKEKVVAFVQKAVELFAQGSAAHGELEALERENPMNHGFSVTALVNGTLLTRREQESRYYFPEDCLEEDTSCDAAVKMVVSHYGFDMEKPWSVYRCKFSWNQRKPSLRRLSLTFAQESHIIPGVVFEADGNPADVNFVHPVTGIVHRLWVQTIEPVKMGMPMGILPGAELPSCCLRMRYTIEPDIPAGKMLLRDASSGDEPRYTAEGVAPAEAAAIGIIGGADGPTAILVASPAGGEGRWVSSSMYFTMPEKVRWRLDFMEKTLQDITVKIK